MMEIKLRSNGTNKFIAESSGKKVTASQLEEGKTYLHQNLYFLRTIISIDTQVLYKDEFGLGRCSSRHFAKTYPNEATSEEIKFLMNKGKDF